MDLWALTFTNVSYLALLKWEVWRWLERQRCPSPVEMTLWGSLFHWGALLCDRGCSGLFYNGYAFSPPQSQRGSCQFALPASVHSSTHFCLTWAGMDWDSGLNCLATFSVAVRPVTLTLMDPSHRFSICSAVFFFWAQDWQLPSSLHVGTEARRSLDI